MPIYDYECENQHRFEKWQSIKDDALTECPECGAPVHKIYHPAGIIFKGSGWYKTDSRNAASAADKAANAAKAKSENGGAAETTSSETKPQADATKTASSESKNDAQGPKTE